MSEAAPATVPAPPRDVRWAPVLRTELWLLIGGLALSIEGLVLALVALVAGQAELPFDDMALDAGATHANGIVRDVEPLAPSLFGGTRHRVRFSFTAVDGTEVVATCYSQAAVHDPGQRASVEYLANDPHVSRLYGTHKAPTPPWLSLLVLGSLAGGFVALVVWMRQVLRLRIALSEGRLTSAKVLSVADARGGTRVVYQFTDPEGTTRRGVQRIRPSELAVSLAGDFAPVIFDLANPKLHRIVTPADFRSP